MSEPKIALLSTGDELANGDVLNTNSQMMAQRLFDHDIQPGMHLTVNDQQAEITRAMRFLLKNHTALIITGGLGPTSDDRTRYALAEVLNTELVFNDNCWQRVIERLQRLSLPIPDSNRQQCLFPPEAIILPNDNGTAAGFQVMHGEQPIFILPGPPFECLPIFEQKVLPYLLNAGFAKPLFRRQWLLLGVSEGNIAQQLDPLVENSGCYIGYRINQPYLEVKLQSANQNILEKIGAQIEVLIGLKSISDQKEKASVQLMKWICEKSCYLTINDRATGGLLESTLLNPSTYPFLSFISTNRYHPDYCIQLSGMYPYWNNQQDNNNHLEINIRSTNKEFHKKVFIPFRRERTLLFALEFACWEIILSLRPLNG